MSEIRFGQRVGFRMGVHIPPLDAKWTKALAQLRKYLHPCDSHSKYRNCWGGQCKCRALRRSAEDQ